MHFFLSITGFGAIVIACAGHTAAHFPQAMHALFFTCGLVVKTAAAPAETTLPKAPFRPKVRRSGAEACLKSGIAKSETLLPSAEAMRTCEISAGPSPLLYAASSVATSFLVYPIREASTMSRSKPLCPAHKSPICRAVPLEGPLPSMHSTASQMHSTGFQYRERSTSMSAKSERAGNRR